MNINMNLEQINSDLTELCVNIVNRHVGSSGNRKATNYVTSRLASAGFEVIAPKFDCIDWEYSEIILSVGSEKLEALISPYSPSCEINSLFETAANVNELETKDFSGKIAVLHHELTKEQIMPKNYVLYNPDEHKRIIKLLEDKMPLAVIAITSRNPELAGGQYPFPLFEDGDFNIPSAYLTEDEGKKLLACQNSHIYLKIDSRRIPTTAFNVIGSKQGDSRQKIVFCAHIDTKKNTPGALDNTTGVTVLLTLADMLQDYQGKLSIELLAVNGEDYYAAPGQMNYINSNRDCFDQIILAVNTDGAGYINGKTSYCCIGCTETIYQAIALAFSDQQKFVSTQPWYQSDHGWFAMYGVPAVAVTSEKFMELTSEITHTPKDTIEKINPNRVYEIASALKQLIVLLNDRS